MNLIGRFFLVGSQGDCKTKISKLSQNTTNAKFIHEGCKTSALSCSQRDTEFLRKEPLILVVEAFRFQNVDGDANI